MRLVFVEDGGDVELFDVDGDCVLVKFKGVCGFCSNVLVMLKGVIEVILKEWVSESFVVEVV